MRLESWLSRARRELVFRPAVPEVFGAQVFKPLICRSNDADDQEDGVDDSADDSSEQQQGNRYRRDECSGHPNVYGWRPYVSPRPEGHIDRSTPVLP